MSFLVMKLLSHPMKLHSSLLATSAKLIIFNVTKLFVKLKLRLAYPNQTYFMSVSVRGKWPNQIAPSKLKEIQ